MTPLRMLTVLLVLTGTCLAVGRASAKTSLADPSPTAVLPSGITPGDLVAARSQELHGALVHGPDGTVLQILDVVWGANSNGLLSPVYLSALNNEGREVVVDNRQNASVVFADLRDIHGVYLTFFGTENRIWADEVVLGVDTEGFLTTLGFSGIDEHGIARTLLPTAFQSILCRYQGQISCVSDGCSVNCPTTFPCTCTGSGTCDQVLIQLCPGAGTCIAPATCGIDPMTTLCGCH